MVRYISNFLKRFFSMPTKLWLIFIGGLLFPILALGSTLSGTVVPSATQLSQYGAAKSWIELTLVVSATIPASIFSLLVFMRRRLALIIFPFSYLSACASPFFLSLVRDHLSHAIASFWIVPAAGIIICGYLYFSREVKDYFSAGFSAGGK